MSIDLSFLLVGEEQFVQLHAWHSLHIQLPLPDLTPGIKFRPVIAVKFCHREGIYAAQNDIRFTCRISLDDTFEFHESANLTGIAGMVQENSEADVGAFRVIEQLFIARFEDVKRD